MDLSLYLPFLGAAFLLIIAPGPDNIYILTKSLAAGARQGVTVAWGLATGPIWHTALVMAGVAAFIQSSPAAFKALTFCGAAYLLYLSYCSFKSGGGKITIGEDKDHMKSFALYRRGFLMNASNPKVLLFFLALLPQFISTGASFPPALQIGIMGLTFSIMTGCIFSLFALCAGKLRNTLMTHENFPLIMSRVEGTLLAAIALGLVLL